MTIGLILNWKPYYDIGFYAENEFGYFCVEKKNERYLSWFAKDGFFEKIGKGSSFDEVKGICLSHLKKVIEKKL